MIDRRESSNDNYLNLLMDASPNLITISDGKKLLSANKTLLNFFKYVTIEDFTKEHECISDFFVPYAPNAIEKRVNNITWIEYVQTNPNRKVAYFLQNNQIKIFNVHAGKLSLTNKTLYAAIFNDITELEQQKQRYAQAIEGSHVGLWDWDMLTNNIYMSPYWKEMLGYSDHELPSSLESWSTRVHPDDLEQALADIKANQEGKTSFYKHIHRLKHKDGHWVWIEDRGKTFFNKNGAPIRMVGTHTDITKQKESEDVNKLHARRAEVLLLLPSISDSLSEYEFMQMAQELSEDLTQSKISFIHFVNDDENTIELVTWSNRTLKHYCNAVYDTHYPVNEAGIWAEALREKRALIFNDYANAAKKRGLPQGHAHLERFMSIPVMEDGKVVMLCGVGNKVDNYTEIDLESVQLIANEIWRIIQRKRSLAKLKEQQEMLIIQSRYSAMGEMISMIAHQWRQPISIIEMCANNIFLDIELDELKLDELKNQLAEMTKQTQYLSNTIDDFRNFFKPHKIKNTALIDTILENALHLMEKSFETHGIKINVNGKTTTPIMLLEKELIQVFLSIFHNAKDALLIRQPLHPCIDIELLENEAYVQVMIKDNAGGIDPLILEKIFEPYFTTKNQKDGTGLGLYMSKVIIEKHLGGHIYASNTQDGASFTINIPK